MSKVVICDKCGTRPALSQFILSYDKTHKKGSEVYVKRQKRTYDLCDKCAINIALTIDKFADAIVFDDSSEE